VLVITTSLFLLLHTAVMWLIVSKLFIDIIIIIIYYIITYYYISILLWFSVSLANHTIKYEVIWSVDIFYFINRWTYCQIQYRKVYSFKNSVYISNGYRYYNIYLKHCRYSAQNRINYLHYFIIVHVFCRLNDSENYHRKVILLIYRPCVVRLCSVDPPKNSKNIRLTA